MKSDLIQIPTFKNGRWIDPLIFKNKDIFKSFILPLFKTPGEYNFDDLSLMFNEQAQHYRIHKSFNNAPVNSKDYIKYWDDQKDKNRNGCIFIDGKKIFYLPRDYYMWINFLPIYDKLKQRYDFPLVWDTQLYISLYELLSELCNKHASILKKRQIASSYFHAAKIINLYWFEEGARLKMGASLKKYVDDAGTWKFLNEYRDFLNQNTAWYRNNSPNKVGTWEQKIDIYINNRKSSIGNKSTINMLSFEKDPTVGVGGPCKLFFYEEAGIAPTMNTTYGYMEPALKFGTTTTGLFVAAGSVGDLKQCSPLKDFILKPEENSMYYVTSNLIDSKGTIKNHALFIPEEFSMHPYIDKFGNSLVEKAREELKKIKIKWKKDLKPAAYQLKVSQHPSNIEEAFAYREESKFPQHLITDQIHRIENNTYPKYYADLYRDSEGNIKSKKSDSIPISEFPVDRKQIDKRGCVIIYEHPEKDCKWGTYIASIDPVDIGKTTTSDSLASIYVYKTFIEKTIIKKNGEKEILIDGDKIVASWCGRYDSIDDTNELMELLVLYYQAWTICENNISSFITHMIRKNLQQYLVPKDKIIFLKEIIYNSKARQEYGWRNTGRMFKDNLLDYLIGFISEELDYDEDENGKRTNIHYGIERIPDIMAMEEMRQYKDGLNVDRLVSLAALAAFIKIQYANRGIIKVTKNLQDKNLNTKDKFSKLNRGVLLNTRRIRSRNPFKHMR